MLRVVVAVHVGSVRQTATILSMSKEHLRTGDKAQVRFRFMKNPEYLHTATRFVFREGRTKAVGTIAKLLPDAPPPPSMAQQQQRNQQKHQQLKAGEAAGSSRSSRDRSPGRRRRAYGGSSNGHGAEGGEAGAKKQATGDDGRAEVSALPRQDSKDERTVVAPAANIRDDAQQ